MDEATDFIFGGIIAVFAWFFGGIDGFLIVLITLAVVDWILGTLNRYTHNGLDSKEFWDVLGKKVGEFSYVGIAHVIDKYMLGDTATFRTAMTLYYIIVESKSVIGHTECLGLPIPQFFKKKIIEFEEKLKDDDNITRGDSIQKAIDSEIFKEPDKSKNDKSDISSIYKNISEE